MHTIHNLFVALACLCIAASAMHVASCGAGASGALVPPDNPGAGNHAPVFTGTPPTAAQVGVGYSYLAAATDADGDALVFDLEQGPSGMSLSHGSTMLWTPAAGQTGDHAVVLAASDGIVTVRRDWVIAVAARVNQPPSIFGTPLADAMVGVAYSYQTMATDPDGDPLTFTAVSAPAGMNVASFGLVAWTPDASQTGMHDVVLSVSDGLATVQTSWQIDVQTPNHPPVLSGTPPGTAQVGVAYSYQAQGSDIDGDVLTYALAGSTPAGMSITVDGLVTWTPVSGQTGHHSAGIHVTDGIGDGFTFWGIDVTAANVPPLITSMFPASSPQIGQLYSYQIVATGVPAPQISVSGVPAWCSFDAGTNTLSGTPAVADAGTTANIVVTADNGALPAATQSFTITVSGGVAPQITSTPVTTADPGQLYSYQIVATGIPAPAIDVAGMPVWCSFDIATNTLSGTPGAADTGTLCGITITTNNGIGSWTLQNFQLTVSGGVPAIITSTPSIDAQVGQLWSYAITAEGTPAPTIGTAGTLPAWVSYDALAKTLSGTPGPAHLGVGPEFFVTANNASTAAAQAIQITVNGPPAFIGVAAPAQAYVGETYNYLFHTTGYPAAVIAVSNLPAWLSFNAATNQLSGTPLDADIGQTDPVTVTASNGISPDASQDIVILVQLRWSIATLDTSDAIGGTGRFSSIALDSNGAAHIAFAGNGTLKYVTNASGHWVVDVVDNIVGHGNFASIGIDSNDIVHIAYYAYVDNANSDLGYATNASGSWTLATIDSDGLVGQYASLAVDSADHLHIAYYDSGNKFLKYASNSAGSWNIEAVGVNPSGLGLYCSIAVDATGQPHIAYKNSVHNLGYATFVAATQTAPAGWVLVEVYKDYALNGPTSITAGPDGAIYIAFPIAGQYRYAKRNLTDSTDAWSIKFIATNTNDAAGQYSSIKINDAGHICVAYYDQTAGALTYAVKKTANASWKYEIADDQGDVGKYASLALDADGKAHIAYFDDTLDDLKYAKRN